MGDREFHDERRSRELLLSHVTLPEDVVDCESWEWNDGAWTRLFTLREWQVGAISIAVSGEQNHHGALSSWLHLSGEDQLNGSDHQRLMEALADARRLLDSLS
jgi:hypothetical protein